MLLIRAILDRSQVSLFAPSLPSPRNVLYPRSGWTPVLCPCTGADLGLGWGETAARTVSSYPRHDPGGASAAPVPGGQAQPVRLLCLPRSCADRWIPCYRSEHSQRRLPAHSARDCIAAALAGHSVSSEPTPLPVWDSPGDQNSKHIVS